MARPEVVREQLARARRGEEGAIQLLLREYETAIRQVVLCSTPPDVRPVLSPSDVLQSLFLILRRQLPRWAFDDRSEDPARFRSYVLRIAGRLTAHKVRAEVRERQNLAVLAQLIGAAGDPSELHEAEVFHDAAVLFGDDWEVVSLYLVYGFNFVEIGATLGRTESSVRRQYHDALERVRRRQEGHRD